MSVLCSFLQFYVYLVFARVILSWVPGNMAVVEQLRKVVDLLTDPVMNPIRKVLPPVRMGTMGLDLTPIAVLFAIRLIQSAICG